MIAYENGSPARIQHFMKVYAFADMIGEAEKLSEEKMEILRAAALVHDIGIRVAEEKYGSCSGKLQEKEGPAIAEKMLDEMCIRDRSYGVQLYTGDVERYRACGASGLRLH